MSSPSPSLEELLLDFERQSLARCELMKELDSTPTTLSYLKYGQLLPEPLKPRKIALLTPFTLETIRPFLDVECYLSGWRCDPVFYQYSQWQPALFDLAGDESCDVDAVLLLLDDATLIEGLGETPAKAASALLGMLEAFRNSSQIPLFLGPAPSRPHDGSLPQTVAENGRSLAMVQAANSALVNFTDKAKDTYLINFPETVTELGAGWHDPKAFAANLSYLTHSGLRVLARDIARTVGPLFVPPRKVLVTDLDNTFWGGIVGEDGIEGVLLGPQGKGAPYKKYQQFLCQLRETGTLLAIASKNNLDDARAVFGERADDLSVGWDKFSAVRIDWNDKAENLIQISDELGLGLDAFVFVDDSPVECERVRQALPMVTVIQAGDGVDGLPERIAASRAFDILSVSDDDRERAGRYQTDRQRSEAKNTAGNVNDFLASLDLTLTVDVLDDENRERAHQLMNKTNQFHLTLERPTPVDLFQRAEGNNEIYCVKLRDKFGDYGIIAVLELEPQDKAIDIRNLVISCRALGRHVEDALVAFAGIRARQKGLSSVKTQFVAGPRNQQVPEALGRIGFSQSGEAEGQTQYVLSSGETTTSWPEYLKLD